MSYIDGEKLAETQVKAVAGFGNTNVGRGTKWKWLNSGNSDHYAILRKGQHTEPYYTLETKDKSYRTIIEVLQRVRDDLTDNYDALLDYADLISARLDLYPHLADTTGAIRDANVTGGNEVLEIWMDQGRTLAWIKTEIFLDWNEDKNVTFAE